MTQPVIFISYSHKDEREKNRLLSHLGVLQREGLIGLWSDDRIGAGADWKQEINEAMVQARLVILLISANFLTSDFILGEEVPTLLKRRNSEGLTVFPVIAKACAWQAVDWLIGMNVRPKNGRPIWGGSGHIDEDLAAIAKEVAAIVKTVPPMTPPAGGVYGKSERAHFSLPAKAYHRLIGRFDELDQIKSALHELKRKPMIAVIGLGGIGKTALIREAADYCWEEKLFDYIAWTSAKTEQFVAGGIVKTKLSGFDFEHLLNEIGHQYGWKGVFEESEAKKKTVIKHLLATRRVLVVLDNLETVAEGDKLVDDIFQILGRGKLILTSRHHVKHEQVFTVNLDGLPKEESVIFLREESNERGIEIVARARRENLIEIYQVTGGAPLAMKLVVGQMSRQSMGVVLNELKEVSFSGQDYEFYRFVFKHSWDMLEQNAKQVLVSMSIFPPGIGGQEEDVRAVSKVTEATFRSALDQLVLMSLVDSLGDLNQRRYAIHQLTQYFILSDIVNVWR